MDYGMRVAGNEWVKAIEKKKKQKKKKQKKKKKKNKKRKRVIG